MSGIWVGGCLSHLGVSSVSTSQCFQLRGGTPDPLCAPMNTDRHAICRREQAAWILSRAAVRANGALGQSRHSGRAPTTSGLPPTTDLGEMLERIRLVPTTDIIGALDTVNSLYEEPFFSCRQGGGSPPPAATGSPSPIRAVSEQHLHAVLSLVRRTGRRSSVPLASRPSGNRFSRFPTNMARGVPGWLVVPRE